MVTKEKILLGLSTDILPTPETDDWCFFALDTFETWQFTLSAGWVLKNRPQIEKTFGIDGTYTASGAIGTSVVLPFNVVVGKTSDYGWNGNQFKSQIVLDCYVDTFSSFKVELLNLSNNTVVGDPLVITNNAYDVLDTTSITIAEKKTYRLRFTKLSGISPKAIYIRSASLILKPNN